MTKPTGVFWWIADTGAVDLGIAWHSWAAMLGVCAVQVIVFTFLGYIRVRG